MRNIAVFCSASELADKYMKPAEEFARLLAQNGYNLVWGGSNTGVMKLVASTVRANGSKIFGVSLEIYKEKLHPNADEMITEKTLGARKTTMLLKSDAIVALVGGIGTLDEVTEIIELKKQNHHQKPVIILNSENFYDGLKIQMEKMEREGFLPQELSNYVHFASTPQDAIEFINNNLPTS